MKMTNEKRVRLVGMFTRRHWHHLSLLEYAKEYGEWLSKGAKLEHSTLASLRLLDNQLTRQYDFAAHQELWQA